MVVLRRPARDLARRATRSRAGSPPPATSGSPATPPGGKLTKRVIFKGLGRDDHNNPSLVFRHDGHIMVFFSPHSGHHLPPPGHPERDALHGLAEPVLDQRLRAGAHRRRPTCPAAWATPIPTRSSCRTSCGSSGAAAAGTRPSPTPRTASTGCRPASSSYFGHAPAAVREVRRRRQAPDPRHLHRRPPENWKNSLHYLRYEDGTSTPSSGRRLGTPAATCRCTPPSSTTSTTTPTGGGRAWGARHRAHRRGPAARRLHAPGQQPRHLLLRLPQRHEVDQPQDRRGRRRPPVLPLGRRDARPRGPARRLPVAHDRPLEPGRAVVHARLGRTWTHRAADHRPRRLRHPPGHAARARAGANRILYVWGDERTIGFTNYTTRVHAVRGLAPPV